jgi:hypothetical protein
VGVYNLSFVGEELGLWKKQEKRREETQKEEKREESERREEKR